MSHEIDEENGDKPIFTKVAAWHRLGTVLENPPSCEEAIKLANLDWKAEIKPLFLGSGLEVSDAFGVVRSLPSEDDPKVINERILGIVGGRYTPLQNDEAFSFFNPLVEQKIFSIDAAGSLFGGKRVWILAKFNEEFSLGLEDKVNRYVLLSNSHDGLSAVVAKTGAERVVCYNTLSMNLADGNADRFNIRHTKTVKDRTAQAFSLLKSIQDRYKKMESVWMKMAEYKLPASEFLEYVHEVFPTPKGSKNEKRIDSKRAEVALLYLNGAGSDLDTSKDTLWGAFNAVTNYTTHSVNARKDATPEKTLNDVWFGKRDEINSKALNVAMDWMKEDGIQL